MRQIFTNLKVCVTEHGGAATRQREAIGRRPGGAPILEGLISLCAELSDN